MPTLADVRRTLVQRSGRYDLVTNAESADYSDNGANAFINAAQRWLDRRLPMPKSPAWLYKVLSAGEAQVNFRYCRIIREVWLASTGAGRVMLDRKPLRWIRENYPDVPLSAVTQNTPQYWCPNIGDLAPEQKTSNDVILSGFPTIGTFEGAHAARTTTSWTFGALNLPEQYHSMVNNTYTYENSTEVESPDPLISLPQAKQTIPIIEGHKYRVQYTLENSLGFQNIQLLLGGVGGALYDSPQDVDEEIIAGGTGIIEVTLGTGGTDLIMSNLIITDITVEYDSDATDLDFIGNNYATRSIILMPPADGTYTVEVLADWYSPSLINDLDTSFWTVEEDAILVRAARMQIEIDLHRNREGVADFAQPILDDLMQINNNLCAEAISGPSELYVIDG